MTVSIVQSKQGGGSGISGTLTITLNSGTTAGNCLIVVIANNASNVVPSGITLGGTALTDDASFTSSGANQAASFWSLPNVASGQTSVVITHSATWSPGVTVLEVSGLATSSVFDVAPAGGTSSAGGQATFDSGSATPAAASGLLLGTCVTFGTSGHTTISPTGTGTWSALTNIQEGSFTDVLGADQIVSGAATLRYTGTLSPSAADWTALAASYKAAGGGTVSGAATLAGTGSLGTLEVQGAGATLAGTGSLGTAEVQGAGATLSAHGSVTTAEVQGAIATLAAAGSIGNAAVQGAGGTLTGTGSLSTAVTQGAGATLAAAGSLGTLEVQGAGGSLAGTGSLSTAVTQGAGATLAAAGSISAASANGSALSGTGSLSTASTLSAPAALAGTASIGNTATQGAGATLAGTASVSGTVVLKAGATLGAAGSVSTAEVLKAGAALAGTASLAGASGTSAESGPFNIILPGGWARRTSGAFALTLPAPHMAMAGFPGTITVLAVRLPAPHMSLTGTATHNLLHITLPAMHVSLTATVIHSAFNIKLPALKTSLTAHRAHAGAFSIQLGRFRGGNQNVVFRPVDALPPPAQEPVTGKAGLVVSGVSKRSLAGAGIGKNGRARAGVS